MLICQEQLNNYANDTTAPLNEVIGSVDGSSLSLDNIDLSKKNLSWSVWVGAHLRNANFSDCKLQHANFSYASLRGASLHGAVFAHADLTDVDLSGVVGDGVRIKTLIGMLYWVSYTKDRLIIGCQNHPIEKWSTFDDNDIFNMDGEAAIAWWTKNKELIFIHIELNPCT